MSSVAGEVRAEAIHPFKSLHEATVDGELPSRLDVGHTGFEAHGVRDRDYVVVYEVEDGHWVPVTQRGWDDPAVSRAVKHVGDRALATVRVDIRPDHVALASRDHGQFELGPEVVDGPRGTLNIFGKEFPFVDQGDDVAAFMTAILGRAVRVVRADRERDRVLPERYRRDDASNRVAGADGYPFLVVNQHSLDASHEANSLPQGTADVRRFRANIVIDAPDLPPYDEDFWRKVQIGSVVLYIVKACARCPIPNVDPDTGEFDPRKGLAVLRGRKGLVNGEPSIVFGQNASHIYVPDQSIAVGDQILVLERADERNFQLASEQ
jgi:uncharacterized protein YcbX